MDLEPLANRRRPGREQSGDGINGHAESADPRHSGAPEHGGHLPPEPSLDLELFKYNPLETVVVDRSGRVVDYNLAKKASGGHLPSRGDVMYRDYAAMHEIDMRAELSRCIEKSESKTFPSLKYHDKYLRITISPFPKGAIIVSQNVTEQTLAGNALRTSEERYRNLFDRVPAGLYSASADGRFLDVNEALVQMLGFPDKESLLAINAEDMYVHPGEFPDMVERLGREATLRDAVSRFYRFDGTAIWIRTNVRAVRGDGNRVERLEGAVEDITERKKAEEALTQSEQEKALILSSVLELVTYQNLDRRIIWANRQAEETFGAGSGQLMGRKCHEVWQGNGTLCAECPMQRILETGSPQLAEKTTPDGRVWATRGYPVRNDAGEIQGIVEVNLDITKQKRAEEDKEKIQAQLLQAQKMEAVGTLAGGVAHDFNNLLTAIQGCLDLAMLKIPEDGPAFSDLVEVQAASRRAADLTRQLLLFSRRHLNHLVPLQLNLTVSDLLKMLHRLIGEDVEITTLLDPGLWNVLADRGTIEQIVVNLTVNSRDAMPDGGKLFLKTENVTVDEFYCKLIPEGRPGRFVLLSIADSGSGMDRETRERIFEPFFSTKGPGNGTGLGLSVVYGIVKQHNGWINVYSEPGRGTEFKIYFPAVFEAAGEKPAEAEEPKNLRGAGERILVVEDETMVREFSLRALEKYGYRAVAVSTMQEALTVFDAAYSRTRGLAISSLTTEVAAADDRPFDMVFTDVVLPDGSGLAMLDQMLKIQPSIKVVLTSGYTDTKSQWKSIQDKGLRFLQKPYTLLDLLRSIRQEFVESGRKDSV
jgi:two-component system, cell cycle sensor histidine kinase and response regulator CckA